VNDTEKVAANQNWVPAIRIADGGRRAGLEGAWQKVDELGMESMGRWARPVDRAMILPQPCSGNRSAPVSP
jgi:hypothetical protein